MNRQLAPADRPATYADVLAAPPHRVAELTRGALHVQPRPAMPQARAASALGARVGGWLAITVIVRFF